MQKASLTARGACSVWGPPAPFGVPPAPPGLLLPGEHSAPAQPLEGRQPDEESESQGSPFPLSLLLWVPPRRCSTQTHHRSRGRRAARSRGLRNSEAGLRRQLRPGEREEEGRIPHCPFQREKGQSPEGSARQGRKHLQPPRSGLHLPTESRGHLHTAQVPPPRCCRSPICNILQGFDAFHVQLQERERIPRLLPCRETSRCCGEGKERRKKGHSCTEPPVKAVRDARAGARRGEIRHTEDERGRRRQARMGKRRKEWENTTKKGSGEWREIKGGGVRSSHNRI